MSEQPEALLQRLERLGQDSVGNYGVPICAEAAAELRRLHEVNAELLEALKRIDEMCAAPPNFSDATMQEIARAASAKAEGKV